MTWYIGAPIIYPGIDGEFPMPPKTIYKYGMRLRGFSAGCQPMDGFLARIDDRTKKYHDILIYKRMLSDKELNDYELDFIEEVKGW